MGGIFSTILDVAGAVVGDPGLGNQIASTAVPGFANITQTPAQIAATVLPDAQSALADPSKVAVSQITPLSQQVATAALPETAAALAAAGYVFPAGSVGANLVKPTVLSAFGGQYESWVLIGGLALVGLLVVKGL